MDGRLADFAVPFGMGQLIRDVVAAAHAESLTVVQIADRLEFKILPLLPTGLAAAVHIDTIRAHPEEDLENLCAELEAAADSLDRMILGSFIIWAQDAGLPAEMPVEHKSADAMRLRSALTRIEEVLGGKNVDPAMAADLSAMVAPLRAHIASLESRLGS
jgi:hypothetical protein